MYMYVLDIYIYTYYLFTYLSIYLCVCELCMCDSLCSTHTQPSKDVWKQLLTDPNSEAS